MLALRLSNMAFGSLRAIGRAPRRVAAHRLLEEGLATEQSKVELSFVEGDPLNFSQLEMSLGEVLAGTHRRLAEKA